MSFRWPESAIGGSSPLTRGKLRWRRNLHHYRRLIPAHAGKTSPLTTGVADSWAHPRSRGENLKQAARDVNKAGSSPLTRGKRHVRCDGRTPAGLIPAHAGKTSRSCSRAGCRGAHPRSRGENGRLHGLDEEGAGSSPLTRGKRGLHNQGLEGGRLIPAHAGKTLRRRLLRVNLRAHPRSRGEN